MFFDINRLFIQNLKLGSQLGLTKRKRKIYTGNILKTHPWVPVTMAWHVPCVPLGCRWGSSPPDMEVSCGYIE